jgi:cell division protein ZapE
MALHLVDRRPEVTATGLLADLVPPPRFAAVSFGTYQPDPREPSQHDAPDRLRGFATELTAPVVTRGIRRRRAPSGPARGVYLDGGFGVGKTHLLASLWHQVSGPKAYATFVELTHLVGALGFHPAVEALGSMTLLAIDEFELDDPGDTVLVSTLLARLSDRGVALAATSNTWPGALGEGRFAIEDFAREIQGLAGRFTSIRIDGSDFRQRGLPRALPARTDSEVAQAVDIAGNASLDDFEALTAHLMTLHPSRYGALVQDLKLVGLTRVRPAPSEATALRLVVLVDRLYDRQIPIATSGARSDQLFTPDLLAGGYRKKYLRATSRLLALERAGRSRSDDSHDRT